jgi:3,4-dihydroxy 2-butanone 4-phosphate synthase/GTP cyclohydrolase II
VSGCDGARPAADGRTTTRRPRHRVHGHGRPHRQGTPPVSAADRARTCRRSPTRPPGPTSCAGPGTCSRCAPARAACWPPGHTEAAVDLMRLAGLAPVGAIGEIVAKDGEMARGEELRIFAAEHDLPCSRSPTSSPPPSHRAARRARSPTSAMPTDHGDFRAVAYRSASTAPSTSRWSWETSAARARPSEACWSACTASASPATSSARCAATAAPARAGAARDREEGCGVVSTCAATRAGASGWLHKIRAYAAAGGGPRHRRRQHRAGPARRLPQLRHRRADPRRPRRQTIRLITNNPAKYGGLEGYGLEIVGRVALPVRREPAEPRYLRTKRDRMGHHGTGRHVI